MVFKSVHVSVSSGKRNFEYCGTVSSTVMRSDVITYFL